MKFQNVSFSFGDARIFDNFSLDESDKRTIITILGPSGCGKTTLLNLASGLLKPLSGTVDSLPASYIFQEPRLLPWYNTIKNVMFPIEKYFSREEAENEARKYLKMVMLEGKENYYPDELSGGQAKRVAIARAFAFPSEILLADEPFSSLDIPLRRELTDTAVSLLKASPRQVMLVTHDPEDIAYIHKNIKGSFKLRVVVLGKPPRGTVFDEIYPGFENERDVKAYEDKLTAITGKET